MLRKGMLSTLSNAVQRASVLIIYVIAARDMEAGKFGLDSSLVALAITIGSLSSLSLGQTANRTLSRLRVARLRVRMAVLIAQASLVTSSASTVFFLIFSTSLVDFVTGESVECSETATIAVAVFAISLGAGLRGHIWAEMRYSALLVSSIASAVTLFAVYGFSSALNSNLPLLQAYSAMVFTEAVILAAVVGVPLSRSLSLLTAPNWRQLRPVLRFSGLATLNGLIFTPVNILLISMITTSLGSDVVGRFNMLVQVRNAIVFLPNGFASVILTLMSRARGAADLWRNSLLLTAMAGLGSLPVGLVAYYWRPAGMQTEYIPLLFVTALTAMIIAMNTNIGQAFLALGRLWVGIAANVVWSLTTLGLVAIVLAFEASGLVAVMVAIMLAYLIHTAIQILLINRTTERAK